MIIKKYSSLKMELYVDKEVIMKNRDWVITKFCKVITEDKKDIYTKRKLNTENVIKFRLLDDDKIVYMYGIMDANWFYNDEYAEDFEPLYYYMGIYGVTEMQVKIDGKYEIL